MAYFSLAETITLTHALINFFPVENLGTVTLLIGKIPAIFQVVHDDFPIEQDAMIGRVKTKQLLTILTIG